jgi:hypothetical protein
MKKADNFDPSKWLVENKSLTNSELNLNEDEDKSKFKEMATQLIDMALTGEIDSEDIKQLTQDLIAARRKMFTSKRTPDQKAASLDKRRETIKLNKLDTQANQLTAKELGLEGRSSTLFALQINSHRDEELQAKWNRVHKEILDKLKAEAGM